MATSRIRPALLPTLLAFMVSALGLVGLLSCLHCGEADEEPEVSAEAIILEYLTVSGLLEHADQFHNRVSVGTFAFPKIGYEGKMTTYTIPPAFRRMEVVQDGKPIFSSGVKDGVAWTIDPVNGSRILEGFDRLRALRQCDFDMFLDWQLEFVSAEVERSSTDADETHHRVVLTSRRGERLLTLFDKQSGLLTRMISQAGSSRMSVDVSDYREVDGMLIPHLLNTDLDGIMTLQIAVQTVRHDVEIPEEVLELPREILELQNSR